MSLHGSKAPLRLSLEAFEATHDCCVQPEPWVHARTFPGS